MHYLMLIFIFILIQPVFAQTKIKVKDSSNGNIIPDAHVLGDNGNGCLTDKKGEFALNSFLKEGGVKITHVSYKSRKISFTNFTDTVIYMAPSIYQTEEVVIAEEFTGLNKHKNVQTISNNINLRSIFNGAADLLKYNTSLYVKDYGGTESAKTISSRGMSSENTVVLFNEAKITDLRSGIFDFSKISSSSFDKIEFFSGADNETAITSAGGVIKINSGNYLRDESTLISFKYNLNKGEAYSFTKKGMAGNLFAYKLNFERAYSSNEYEFNYAGQVFKRKNAHYSKAIASAGLIYNPQNFLFDFYGDFSNFSNGIPGFVVKNNMSSSGASNFSQSGLAIFNAKYFGLPNFEFHSTLSYNNQLNIFNDPAKALFASKTNNASRMEQGSFTTRMKYFADDFYLQTIFEYSSASISGMNCLEKLKRADDNFRDVFFAGASFNYSIPVKSEIFNSLNLFGALNYNFIKEMSDFSSTNNFPTTNIGFAITDLFSRNLDLKFSYSFNRRVPTLNEIYYSSLFPSKGLHPEKYYGFDISIEKKFNFIGNQSVSVTYFDFAGEDKIIWLPTGIGLQIPRNFGSMNSDGLELILKNQTSDGNFGLDLIYNFTNARNKNKVGLRDNAYEKLLPYSPQHRFNINTFAKFDKFTINLFNHFESERYFTSDNSISGRIDGFFVTDISVVYKFSINEYESSIVLSGYNIFNTAYNVIQSYPMPLRDFTLTYNLEIK